MNEGRIVGRGDCKEGSKQNVKCLGKKIKFNLKQSKRDRDRETDRRENASCKGQRREKN